MPTCRVIEAPMGVTPIVKVVGNSCNLRCSYCFYNPQDQSTLHVMSDELLEKFIAEYMGFSSKQHRFVWHGGEPLLAGIAFFQRTIELQEKHLKKGHRVVNDIQTNATLIDSDWANFFKVNNFRVGVSLDGDKKSHDRFRKNCGGGDTFNRVMRGIEILKRYDVSHGFLQTLTKDNLPRAQEDFNFFVDVLSTRAWGVNPYLDITGSNNTMLNQNVTNEDLIEFLKGYVELWLRRDYPNLRIREIENFFAGIGGKRAANCSFNGSCTGFFCLEWDGKIYPCDRFSGREDMLFGDLSNQPLLEILNGPARLHHISAVRSLPPSCSTCEWLNACHNGCPYHRVDGVEGKYYYCEARKEIFTHLKAKVDEYEMH